MQISCGYFTYSIIMTPNKKGVFVMFKQFTINAHIKRDIHKVWDTYHQPKHIKKWNNASSDWHTPFAESDFREGGNFCYRMEAKDGSAGFDFIGTFDVIDKPNCIKYHMDDQRKVVLNFKAKGIETDVEVMIDAEDSNSIELQKRGWQAILNNFKKYVESLEINC